MRWLVLPLVLLMMGCGTRSVRTDVMDHAGLTVFMRHRREAGEEVERGFQHPAVISAERLSHILAAIDIQTGGIRVSERQPALHPDILQRVANGLSQGFARANVNQELGVVVVRRQRRFGIFHRKFLTSFVAYMKEDALHLHFSRVEWAVPEMREDNLPEPRIGDRVMDFRVMPARGMHSLGPQVIAVNWHDPLFGSPVSARRGAGGEVIRRTVLMESPLPPESTTPPEGLSAESLRELADLEEAREKGEVTEAYYQRRRAQLIESATPDP